MTSQLKPRYEIQAPAIAAEHQELFDILAEIDLSKTFKLLTERHTHRMQILGLAP